MLTERPAEELNELFAYVLARDGQRFDDIDYKSSWLSADRLRARGQRNEMGFHAFESSAHIKKFFNWLRSTKLVDPLPADAKRPLCEKSTENDKRVCDYFHLDIPTDAIENVARYNAQDYLYQRIYPMPEDCSIRTILDFGAGHGRMANLALLGPSVLDRASTYIAVEGISSTYFTQHFYWKALGLKVWDYMEAIGPDLNEIEMQKIMSQHDVIHIPTWRLDLLPENSVDMVTCVQVLKEPPGILLPHIPNEFPRICKDRDAIYIRDHIQFHNPNHMPIDAMIQASGFTLEFSPQLKDRVEIHGLPRIWRKFDSALFLTTPHPRQSLQP